MSSLTGSLNRRDFLLYAGAAVAGVTLGEAGRRQLARADERASAWRTRGVERWATSVCLECPAACGVRVRLVDDVPVKLDGNPNCPIARGRLCAKGQAAIESYFDPDRLTGPARRVGARGENRWQPVAWDEAATLMAARWPHGRLTDAAQPLALGGGARGPLADNWSALWSAAGAHVAWTPSATAARLRPSLSALTGLAADPLFDLAHATYVLSFGAPIVEDWLSPLWAQRSYGRFRRAASQGRGRLVQIDVRRSMTARKADEWIALPAERHVALAYGIASVMLRERRADAAFLDQYGGTLDTFEPLVTARFSPDDAAALTGVPVVTILRLARELAASPQALVAVAADAERPLVDAVFALNALIGAFDRAGGVFASPARPVDDVNDASLALRELALGKRRPAFVALHDASPLRAPATPALTADALDAVPFIVSFSPYLDDAAAIADLVVPTHTALESWHMVTPASAVPAELVAAVRPAVSARLNTRDVTALLKRIARDIGGAPAAAAARNSSEEIVRSAVAPVAALHRGGPYRSAYETEWLRQLEQGGWWVPGTDGGDSALDVVLDAGGWMDPGFQPGSIRESLRARGGLTFTLPVDMSARPVVAVTQPAGTREPLRLRMVPFTPSVVNLAGSPNQPVLFELLGQPDGAPWSAWAELDGDLGRELGIHDGDRVRIVSAAGHVEAQVQLVEGMSREHVAVSFVPGFANAGRWAAFLDQDLRRLCGRDGIGDGCDVAIVRA